jgi:hypothetical protein
MITACQPGNILGCAGDLAGGVAGGVATSAWDSVCKSIAEAAVKMLTAFAEWFVAFPNVNLDSAGVSGVYNISLWIAGIIAAILLIGQVVRTAVTHDGSGIAHGLIGLVKAALAFVLTLAVAKTALAASDEIATGIINRSFGSAKGLQDKLTGLFTMTGPNMSTTLLGFLGLVGLILVLVLWFELLLRNGAVAVLIASSPIAASGQISETAKSWWSKLVTQTIALIVLKPVIALVFAVGFGLLGNTPTDANKADVATLLAGMLVLLLAAIAWPAIARFFTFAQTQVGGGAGLGAVLGFGAGRANAGTSPAGVNPAQFSQMSEARTMSATGAGGAAETAAAEGATGAAGSAGAAGGMAAAGAVAAPLLIAAAGLDIAQRAANSLTGRMEQMAAHAGIEGANHYARPAGYPQYAGGWTSSLSTQAASQPAAGSEVGRGESPVATATPPPQPGAIPETEAAQHIPAQHSPVEHMREQPTRPIEEG